MPSPTPSPFPCRKRGNSGNSSAKGRTLLLAAVCAFLTSSTSAFSVGPLRGPAHIARTPSTPQTESALSSSPNDDAYFFTAPPQSSDGDNGDEAEIETKTTTPIENDVVSAEQTELESMEVATAEEEEEDLLSTTAVASASSTPPVPSPALSMDVDGNGTGALMKRSPAAGGVHAPLMATNPSLAFPIDSGKEGMQAHDTKAITSKPSKNGIVDASQLKTRLVRYELQCSDDALQPKQSPTQKKLVLAPASGKSSMNSELAKPKSQKPTLQPPKPRLVRYNGPDVESTTDYDGMELSSVKKNRNREIQLRRANLVRYQGESQLKPLMEEVPNSNDSEASGKPGTEEDHQKGRRTLVEDPGYANRYTGLSDFNTARKSGLAVNKPESLWGERDKFL